MATLEDYEDLAETPVATRPGGKSDLKDLPNGEYQFEITKMHEKSVTGGRLILEIAIEVITDSPHLGMKFDLSYWMNKKDGQTGELLRDEISFNRFRKDLETLGFDTPLWNKANGRSFKAEFNKACAVIEGVRFNGKKVTNDGDDGKKYHNLYVNKRVESDGKPVKFGPEELAVGADPFGGGDGIPN